MDVIEKIWSMGHWGYTIAHGCCYIEGQHESSPRIYSEGKTTIEAAWGAVILFIKWHKKEFPYSDPNTLKP